MIVIKKPVVTEKTVQDYKENNRATFEVDMNTNKLSAVNALEKAFGVEVEKVWVKNRLGKTRVDRLSNRLGKRSQDKKIMIFQLKKGSKIDFFGQQ